MIEPIAETDLPYIGWIPTANGRLSFRHVGDTKYPRVCIYSNFYGADRTRLIVAIQTRNLSDLLFACVSEPFLAVSGKFMFALACASQKENAQGLDSLVGDIGISLPDHWYLRRLRLLTPVDLINETRLLRGNQEKTQAAFKTFKDLTANGSEILVRFRLLRNGIVEFEAPRFTDDRLRLASQAGATFQNVDFSRYIADQAYFFLRDLCHFHQHHEPATDTILTLQERLSSHRDWRNCILYSLHHYVIRARRSNRVEDLHRATGVLGYAKAFTAITELVASEKDSPISVMQSDAIGQSISAKAAEMNAITAVDAQTTTVALANRSAFLTIFAVVISTLSAVSLVSYSNEAKYARPYLQKLHDHPAVTIVALFSLLVLALVYFSESAARLRRRRRLKNLLWWRDTLAAVRSPRPVSVLVATASTFLFASMIWLASHYP